MGRWTDSHALRERGYPLRERDHKSNAEFILPSYLRASLSGVWARPSRQAILAGSITRSINSTKSVMQVATCITLISPPFCSPHPNIANHSLDKHSIMSHFRRYPVSVARFLTLGFTICIGLASDGLAGESADALALSLDKPTPEVLERGEIRVDGVPAADNPLDPDCITLDLTAVDPSGHQVTVPGFYFRDYQRQLDGQQETLSPQGDGEWRIRWLPVTAGEHTLRAAVTVNGKTLTSEELTVNVTDSKRNGIVRVEPTSKRYFQLDNGTPLFLNGLCSCWYGSRGTYDYDDWLAAYEQAGINYIRIWMWPNAFGLEWDKNDKLAYRLDNAWRLDYLLAEAQRRGVYVMVCLDYHGIFEVKPDYWGGNNYWPRHPYNAANGGPCQTQNDFFTNEQAKQLYRKRLRYLVARWSAYPSVLAWEFFNEIDNEYAYVKHDDVVAWHGELGRHLRQIDPLKHLISSSFTGGSQRPDLFALPEMDFAQYHSYNEQHPAEMTANMTATFFQKYRKPFFVSEYGTDWRGWKPDTDPYFRALHQAVWSGAMSGAAGTDMTWWWEEIHRGNLYRHWSALAAFLQGTGMGRPDFQPARFDQDKDEVPPVLAFGVAARDEALVWLLDRACNWPAGAMNDDPPKVTDAGTTLTGLDDGKWSVQWWDTLEGKCIASREVTAQNGRLQLTAPPFQVDIAARLKKQ